MGRVPDQGDILAEEAVKAERMLPNRMAAKAIAAAAHKVRDHLERNFFYFHHQKVRDMFCEFWFCEAVV